MKSWLIRSLTHYRSPGFKDDLIHWGTPDEREIYARLSCAKRRRDWLIGRLTAKETIQRHWRVCCGKDLRFDDIEILNDSLGRPYCKLCGRDMRSSLTLSISHRQGLAFCALVDLAPGEGMGVDIEYLPSSLPTLFTETFYTGEEEEQLRRYEGRDYLKAVAAIWSLKEATLKALGLGLTVDTKKVEVFLSPLPWNSWKPQTIKGDFTEGCVKAWMRYIGCYVLTWAHIKTEE